MTRNNLKKVFPFILVIGGLIGLVASGVLVIEKLNIAANPDYVPSCSLNPILACGSVMETDQAEAFGFPNMLIGVASFSVLITVGMALFAGARFKKWFWQGLLAGSIFGAGFITWLFYHSVYVIGALCLYCIIVWAAVIPIFIFTLQQYAERYAAKSKLTKFFTYVKPYQLVVVWYLLIAVAILIEFWFYWKTTSLFS
ncbi:TPA: vitamin K epoxide reductase family protein [Candidatus Saccharibacteria bacterium]|nr:vitamin K epoxide reductase family protein [Candidatus Saccharibacteria bacterium]HIO87930.1 vitamin K epoxide reductase family protein [Candidatus Saccharibacteria bacterium]